MTTHQEIRTIEHKGIKVSFKLDYDIGTATLVEKVGPNWQGKQWLFKGRELEYMDSWICILEAMQEAVKECKKSLEANMEVKEQLQTEAEIRIQKMFDGLVNKDAML